MLYPEANEPSPDHRNFHLTQPTSSEVVVCAPCISSSTDTLIGWSVANTSRLRTKREHEYGQEHNHVHFLVRHVHLHPISSLYFFYLRGMMSIQCLPHAHSPYYRDIGLGKHGGRCMVFVLIRSSRPIQICLKVQQDLDNIARRDHVSDSISNSGIGLLDLATGCSVG